MESQAPQLLCSMEEEEANYLIYILETLIESLTLNIVNKYRKDDRQLRHAIYGPRQGNLALFYK